MFTKSPQLNHSATLFFSLLALGASLGLLPFYYFVGDDGVYYARAGANLLGGLGLSANPGVPYLIHPPFYPLLIGAADLLFKNLEFSGHFLSSLAFALSIFPLFHLAKSMYSLKTALWTAFLYTTNGFLLVHSNLIMADMPFNLLILLQLALLHTMLHSEDRWSLRSSAFGLLAGLAYLTRPEALLFYLAGAAALLGMAPKSLSWKRRGTTLGLSLACFLVVSIPYVRFLYQQTGHLQLSGGATEILIKRQLDISPAYPGLEGKKTYMGLAGDKTRLKMDELAEGFDFLDTLTRDHCALLKSAAFSLPIRILELSKYLYGGLGFLWVGACLLGAPWDERRKKSEFLLLLFLATFLARLFSQFLPRYFLLYFPILLMWMGEGIEVFRKWAQASFGLGRKGSLALAAGLCLTLSIPSGGYIHWVLSRFPPPLEYKELGLWMKTRVDGIEKEGIASRQPAVSFYSGARILKLPYIEKPEDLRTYLRHSQANYFVAASDFEPPFNEAYRPFLDETRDPPAGFVRVRTVTGKRNLLLYRMTSEPAPSVSSEESLRRA